MKDCTLVLILLAASVTPPTRGESATPLRRATAWTRSNVRGSPEPPPPYRTERAFPYLTFKSPVLVAPLPGRQRLVVAEQEGRIFSFAEEPACRDAEVFLDLRAIYPRMIAVYGLAFDPEFESNGGVYICYVLKNGENGSHVSRFRVDADDPVRCDPATEERLLSFRGGGHNGGCLQFGPDGHLYISTGDGAGPFPPDGLDTGQDNSDLLSAILRISTAPSSVLPYSVPADNPFVGLRNVRPEIWAYGFRNPWKMSFDPRTGDLWVGDVGWELWEMIYRVTRGGNYGWSVTEGRQSVHPERARGLTPILPPVVDHSHAEARSITGGRVYLGDRLRDLHGAYVYADYETGKVWGLRHDGSSTAWHEEIAVAPLKIVAFGEGFSHELYLLDHAGGALHRLVENETPRDSAAFPRRLSDTGLFTSTRDGTLAPGVVSYELNVEPWADHATTRRCVGLPGATQIERPALPAEPENAYRARWGFPPDAVLAKTFELEMERGNPASRRRIETQILHHVGAAWRGYSYAWNDDGTDATLVEASGRERIFTIVDRAAPGGERRQAWRFPGRGECNVCHNHFNGYVLGFTLRQLNRALPGRSGGTGIPQLRHLEEEGLFSRRYPSIARLPAFPQSGGIAGDDIPDDDPTGESAPLAKLARAYLHVNCSHCHRRHGGGTSWIELPYEIPLDKTHTVGRPPSQGSFGIADGALVVPGHPERSLVYYRMATLGPPRMPHMGSNAVDARGLQLVRTWIAHLPAPHSESDPAPSADVAALNALRSSETSSGRIGELVERVVSSTSGALRLVTSLDREDIPSSVRSEVIEKAAASADLNTRGLFTRFLPATRRPDELGRVIELDRILARSGAAARGRQLFLENDALQCRGCHTVDGTLRSVGPDLSLVGRRLTRREILESIVSPAASVPPRYAPYLLVTKDGEAYTGIVKRKAAAAITLADGQNRTVVLPTEDIEALTPQQGTLMPEQLLRGLTTQEATDLLEYLCSLR